MSATRSPAARRRSPAAAKPAAAAAVRCPSDVVLTPPGLALEPWLYAVIVNGDSMEPAYYDGDAVVVSLCRAAASGHDCLVVLDPELQGRLPRSSPSGGIGQSLGLIKRIFFEADGQVRLQPLNPKYEPLLLRAGQIMAVLPIVVVRHKGQILTVDARPQAATPAARRPGRRCSAKHRASAPEASA